jgi:hypothetical protein
MSEKFYNLAKLAYIVGREEDFGDEVHHKELVWGSALSHLAHHLLQ